VTIARHIAAAVRSLGPGLAGLLEALLLLLGAGLISYGAWLVYVPAGFITAGTIIIAGIILRARGSGG